MNFRIRLLYVLQNIRCKNYNNSAGRNGLYITESKGERLKAEFLKVSVGRIKERNERDI